jgi:hypothetical protein
VNKGDLLCLHNPQQPAFGFIGQDIEISVRSGPDIPDALPDLGKKRFFADHFAAFKIEPGNIVELKRTVE